MQSAQTRAWLLPHTRTATHAPATIFFVPRFQQASGQVGLQGTAWHVSRRGWLQTWLSPARINKTSSCCLEQCVVTTTRHLVKQRKPCSIHPNFKAFPSPSPPDFSRQVQIICQRVVEKAGALVWPLLVCCPKSPEGGSGMLT